MNSSEQRAQPPHAVALISIGSATSIPDVVAAYVKHAKEKRHDLTVIPLDTLEGINGLILRGDSETSAQSFTEDKLQEVRDSCGHFGADVRCQPYSHYAADKRLTYYDGMLTEAYRSDSRFQRAADNQTFHNLYPILKRLGIEKRDSRLRSLTEFLLREIALKCFLGNEQVATFEYGHTPMMSVLADIYRKRYAALEPIVRHALSYDEVQL